MTNWLDRLRGEGQGRMEPRILSASAGEHVFILGSEGCEELAVLSEGDYSEIRQMVDLTDWDLVAATLDTIGVAMGQAQPRPGFSPEDNPLWWFNFDIGELDGRNLIEGGFGLTAAGDLEIATEDHSPAETYCRKIPIGGTAQLDGVNNPQWMTSSPLDQYTLQVWVNFDSESHVSSAGINPNIFKSIDSVPNGLWFDLHGFPTPHEWSPEVWHYNGGVGVKRLFPGVVLDTNWGWTLLTVVWDVTLPLADRLLLYVNDEPDPYYPSMAMANSPIAPALDSAIQVADPLLYGLIDEMRLLDSALSSGEIADSYTRTTEWPDAIDYQWLMQIAINEEVYAERVISPGEQRRWSDFRAPVRHLSGTNEVCFRLRLNRLSGGR